MPGTSCPCAPRAPAPLPFPQTFLWRPPADPGWARGGLGATSDILDRAPAARAASHSGGPASGHGHAGAAAGGIAPAGRGSRRGLAGSNLFMEANASGGGGGGGTRVASVSDGEVVRQELDALRLGSPQRAPIVTATGTSAAATTAKAVAAAAAGAAGAPTGASSSTPQRSSPSPRGPAPPSGPFAPVAAVATAEAAALAAAAPAPAGLPDRRVRVSGRGAADLATGPAGGAARP